ncbi:hypothetical protein [Glaciecola sp. SC05]|uniref:hypothetical protein n=1 Tax=Glaciecola sp. SC05 TaxID=1987355 RepID=UPI0035280ECF
MSNPVIKILGSGEATATICGISIDKPQSLTISFDEITTNKTSGSHPLGLEIFVVKTAEESYILQLGQDSRDRHLFWIYPESGQLNTIVGGFIKSEYLEEYYARCK